jgi:hypothetical protein
MLTCEGSRGPPGAMRSMARVVASGAALAGYAWAGAALVTHLVAGQRHAGGSDWVIGGPARLCCQRHGRSRSRAWSRPFWSLPATCIYRAAVPAHEECRSNAAHRSCGPTSPALRRSTFRVTLTCAEKAAPTLTLRKGACQHDALYVVIAARRGLLAIATVAATVSEYAAIS